MTPVLMLPPLVTNKQEHHENTTNVDSWYNVINTNLPIKPFQKDYGQGSTRVIHAHERKRKSIRGHNMVH